MSNVILTDRECRNVIAALRSLQIHRDDLGPEMFADLFDDYLRADEAMSDEEIDRLCLTLNDAMARDGDRYLIKNRAGDDVGGESFKSVTRASWRRVALFHERHRHVAGSCRELDEEECAVYRVFDVQCEDCRNFDCTYHGEF